jgi:hypothetical protein
MPFVRMQAFHAAIRFPCEVFEPEWQCKAQESFTQFATTGRFMPYAKHRSYLAVAKSWKIRNMIAGYVHARLTFQQHWRPKASDHHVPTFEIFKKICDILQQVKDDHHLVYRRADPANGDNERHKLVPGYAEAAFVNHVGLLFHKVMVGKELRYILEHYAHDERNWHAHFQELQTNLASLERLFEQDRDALVNFVRSQSDNVLVLAFLLEEQRGVAKCFGIRPTEVLGFFANKLETNQVHYLVAQYHYESGWYERAHEMIQKALQKNSGEERVQHLMQQVENKLVRQKRRARAQEKERPLEAMEAAPGEAGDGIRT